MPTGRSPQSRARTPIRSIGVALSAAILVISGVGYAAATGIASQVKREDVFGPMTGRPANDGGQNILVVGSDDRSNLTPQQRKALHTGKLDYGRHTDSMMIVHIADDGSVGVVSIPRDSLAEIPTYTSPSGHTTSSTKQKINAAYMIGGPTLAVETVEKNTGVRIDHYAEVNFAGFVSMVDSLGGVPVCTKTAITDEKAGLDLPAGTTTLNGAQALAYVRARYFDPSADVGRMKRQQTFLGSVFKKATSPVVLLNPTQFISFLDGAANSVTTDNQLDRAAMWNLISQLRSVSPSAISFQTVPIASEATEPGVGSVVVWDQEKSAALFAKLKTGEPLSEAHGSSTPTVEKAPSAIVVRMFNGSSTAGLATRAGKELATAGFDVVGEASNARERTGENTVIQYDSRYDTSLKTLQAALPYAEVEEVENLGRTFRVIVGSGYEGVKPFTVAGTEASTPATGNRAKTAADDICG